MDSPGFEVGLAMTVGDKIGGLRMVDVFAVADLLVSKVTNCHAGEVDLVAYYGSYAQGRAGPGSDLDIFYIPVEGKDPPVGRTVLIAGVLFDFWPIRWDTMEGFATGQLRGWSVAPAIVHHAQVIYRRSKEAEMRLDALKQKIADLQKPAARPLMIRRSLDMFKDVLAHLGNLRLAAASGRLDDLRHAGFQVVLSAWECLALANQAFFDQGLRSITSQAHRLHSKPTDFERMVVTVGTSSDADDILAAAEGIVLGTREVLLRLQQSVRAERSVPEQFGGAYPEIRDGLRKVVSACKQQRRFEASIAAWSQQDSLSAMLTGLSEVHVHYDFNLYSEYNAAYHRLALPDLMGCGSDDLAKLAEETERLDQRLRRWLTEHSVGLQEFATVEDFERSL